MGPACFFSSTARRQAAGHPAGFTGSRTDAARRNSIGAPRSPAFGARRWPGIGKGVRMTDATQGTHGHATRKGATAALHPAPPHHRNRLSDRCGLRVAGRFAMIGVCNAENIDPGDGAAMRRLLNGDPNVVEEDLNVVMSVFGPRDGQAEELLRFMLSGCDHDDRLLMEQGSEGGLAKQAFDRLSDTGAGTGWPRGEHPSEAAKRLWKAAARLAMDEAAGLSPAMARTTGGGRG